MSRLEELIAELCPVGVEYKTLGEIGTAFYRGSGISREQLMDQGTPCVRYGEIYTTYNIWFDKCVSFTDKNIISNKKYFQHGDVLFAITGESVDEIAKSCVYIGNEECLAGGDIVVMKHNQNPKYMGYVLSTDDAQKQKSRGKIKSKVVHSSVPAIQGIVIPVPPLPVQEEVVRILDNFTELTAELTAELTKRKEQYQYYSNALFNKYKVERESLLKEICSISIGEFVHKNKQRDNAKYPVYNGGTTYTGFYDEYNNKGNKIIISARGANAGYINKISGKFWAGNSCYSLGVLSKEVNWNFLYYYLKNSQARLIGEQQKGSIPAISKKQIENFSISIPSLEEQARIVAILDRFDALCNDLTSGLPAEIEARKKQYEYYRDKLLTFKEAKQ